MEPTKKANQTKPLKGLNHFHMTSLAFSKVAKDSYNMGLRDQFTNGSFATNKSKHSMISLTGSRSEIDDYKLRTKQ